MIDSLHITNFKAFQKQDLRIAPLTILTGLNGSGKSSFMQAILLLRQAFESGLMQQGLMAINGEYVRLGTPADVRNESSGEDEVSFRYGFTDSDPVFIAFSFMGESDRVTQLKIDAPKFSKSGLFGHNFTFLAADRIVPQVYYELPSDFKVGGRVGVHGEKTVHFLSQHGDSRIPISALAHTNGRSMQLSHQVEAWLGEVSPGVQIHSDSQSSLDIVSLSYSFLSRRDVSSKYRAPNVGFGLTYVLPVLVAVLSSQPGDLLLIESPEAHLHPKGQAKLGELFAIAAEAGVQLIVETHSDHVLNGVRVAVHQNHLRSSEVLALYFRWNPGTSNLATTVETVTMDANGRIEHWPEGFFDEFDKSLDVLLTVKPEK